MILKEEEDLTPTSGGQWGTCPASLSGQFLLKVPEDSEKSQSLASVPQGEAPNLNVL